MTEQNFATVGYEGWLSVLVQNSRTPVHLMLPTSSELSAQLLRLALMTKLAATSSTHTSSSAVSRTVPSPTLLDSSCTSRKLINLYETKWWYEVIPYLQVIRCCRKAIKNKWYQPAHVIRFAWFKILGATNTVVAATRVSIFVCLFVCFS